MLFSADNQILVAKAGGIGAILSAMKAHPSSAGIQEKACGALWSISVNGMVLAASFRFFLWASPAAGSVS